MQTGGAPIGGDAAETLPRIPWGHGRTERTDPGGFMRPWSYALFALATLPLALLSGLSALFNPVTLLMVHAASLPLAGAGAIPLWVGPNSWDVVFGTSFLWPLTLAPLHGFAFRRLRIGVWGYLGLVFVVGTLIAGGLVLLHHGGTDWPEAGRA